MNDLLGILIPLLMSGADIQTILRQLSGAGGSASYDGLQRMIADRNSLFNAKNPLAPDRDKIHRHAEAFLDTLNINPFTGPAQGFASLITSMYSIAPDMVGAIIGLPTSGSFYQQIANGYAGVSMASGRGLPSIFNPYSARDAYNNSVKLARSMHDMATRPGGGYNVDFTHGLNMNELGTVAQRLLSSNIPYMGYNASENGDIDFSSPTGKRVDTESDEFKQNLAKLGSKFNEAVSMLSKITGSVKDAMDLMDRLAGGNFLGGSAEEALGIARKARNMAANIRLTSAMAGVDPKEAYANIRGLQQGLTSIYGIDANLASASGLDAYTTPSAYKGVQAYQNWLALNPNATEHQKRTVMAGAMGRVLQYADTSGEHLAAMVAANREKFTDEDIRRIETAYRMGRPNEAQAIARRAMGNAAYDDYMNDPAAIMGFRLHAGSTEEGRELLDRFENAALTGNLFQAELEGGRRMFNNDLSASDNELVRTTGIRTDLEQGRKKASEDALRELAVKHGLKKDQAAKWNLDELTNWLSGQGVDPRKIEREGKTAALDYQIGQINNLAMSESEEKQARNKLLATIDNLPVSDDIKNDLKTQLGKAKDLNAFYDKLAKDNNITQDKNFFGGKISRGHAEKLKNDLANVRQYWSVDNTKEEMKRAVNALAGQFSIKNSAALAGVIAGDSFRDAKKTDREALAEFEAAANEQVDAGMLSFGKKGLEGTRQSAYENAVASKLFKGGIGDLKDVEKDKDGKEKYTEGYQNLLTRVASGIQAKMNEKNPDGSYKYKSIQEAQKAVLSKIAEDSDVEKMVGKGGIEEIKRIAQSDADKDNLSRSDIASAERTAIVRESSEVIQDASREMFDAIDSESKDAGKKFLDNAKILANAKVVDKKKLDELKLDTEEGQKKLGTAEGRRKILEQIAPDAYNKRLNGLAASMGSNNPRVAALAWTVTQAELSGMSFDDMRTMLKEQGYGDDEVSKALDSLDKDAANRNQNALSNAINMGSGSISKKEVERSRKMIGDLRDKLGDAGIKADEISKYSELSDEDKKKKRKEWSDKLAKVEVDGKKVFEDSDYTAKMMASLSEKGKVGQVTVSDILNKDKNVDLKKLGDEGLADVTRRAGQKDSAAYESMEILSVIAEKVGKLLSDPVKVLISDESPVRLSLF